MLDVQQLIDRVKNLSMEERLALDRAITPEIGEILLKVAPELEPLVLPLIADEFLNTAGGQTPQPPMPGANPPSPNAAPAGLPPLPPRLPGAM